MHRINLFTCVKQYKFRPCSFLKQLNIKFIIILSIEFTVNGFLKHTACSSMGIKHFTVSCLNQVCVHVFVEKLVDCVCCYRWENSVACDISVVGSMGNRHVPVTIMV